MSRSTQGYVQATLRRPRTRPRRAIGLLAASLAAVVLATCGIVTAAHADLSSLDPSRLRYQLFVSNERLNVRGNQFWIRGVEQAYLLDYRAANPNATEQELVARLAWFDQRLHEAGLYDGIEKPVYQLTAGALQALADAGIDPISAGGASFLKTIADMTVGAQVETFGSVQDQIAGSWQTQSMMRFNNVMDAILERTVRTAEGDQAFGTARDAFFGGLSRASVYNTVENFLRDPELETLLNTQSIITMLNSQNVSRDFVIQLVRTEFAQLGGRIDTVVANQVAAANAANTARPIIVNGPRGSSASYNQALAESQQNERTIEALRSGVYVLSTLVGIANPTLSRQIATLGNGALQIASAINKYLPTIKGMSTIEALTSMSTAVFTGNMVAAVMTLVPMFVDMGPTPDQMMMEQMQALRQDVASLANGMNDRFNRVEQGLNTIYSDMMIQFDRVLTLLGGIGDHLTEIGHALVTLQSRVDALGEQLISAIEANHLLNLRIHINGALGYQRRYHEPLTRGAFNAAENMFQLYAESISSDPVSVEPLVQDSRVQNADIHPNLATAQLPRSLGYLTWLANTRFQYGITVRPMPNPNTWALAARSYARLMIENAAFAHATEWQPTVRSKGSAIDELTRDISRPATGGGTNTLFTKLLANYRTTVTTVASELRAEHVAVLGGRTVNLFADASQATSAPANLPTMSSCGSEPALSTPANMQPAGLPNAVYTALAGYRGGPGVPQIANCYTVAFRETNTVYGPRFTVVNGAGDVTVQTRVRLSDLDPWRVVRTATATAWNGVLEREDRVTGAVTTYDPAGLLRAGWDSTHRARFEAATPVVDAAIVASIADSTNTHLRAEAKRYLGNVATRLGQPSTLRTAVTAMTGAATLLRAYGQVGFPKALEADELMNAMLLGNSSIVSEASGRPMVSATYGLAYQRYVPCAAGETEGCTAAEHLYQPLWEQPFVTAGLPAPSGVTMPGDPVGDALISSALSKLTLLGERIELHSQRMAAGQEAERLPLFEEVSGQLGLVKSVMLTSD